MIRRSSLATATVAALLALSAPALAQKQGTPGRVPAATAAGGAAAASPVLSNSTGVQAPFETVAPAQIGPGMNLTIGKSTLVRLPAPISRISVGNPTVADVTLISPTELYLLGKTYGSTNIILWSRNGPTTIIDVAVSIDSGALQARLRELLPTEEGIVVRTAAKKASASSGGKMSCMRLPNILLISVYSMF